MAHVSVQSTDRIFVKSYGSLSFAKIMGKKIGKNISKNLNGNHSRNFLIMINNLQQVHLKLLQK